MELTWISVQEDIEICTVDGSSRNPVYGPVDLVENFPGYLTLVGSGCYKGVGVCVQWDNALLT